MRRCAPHIDGRLRLTTATVPILTECGNMLYMTLAHATYSGKLSLIQDHYPILRQWAEYLVNETQYPINQAVSDGSITE